MPGLGLLCPNVSDLCEKSGREALYLGLYFPSKRPHPARVQSCERDPLFMGAPCKTRLSKFCLRTEKILSNVC